MLPEQDGAEPSAVYSIPAKLIYGHKAKNNKCKPINKSGGSKRLNKSAGTTEHQRLKTVVVFQGEDDKKSIQCFSQNSDLCCFGLPELQK